MQRRMRQQLFIFVHFQSDNADSLQTDSAHENSFDGSLLSGKFRFMPKSCHSVETQDNYGLPYQN